MNIKTLALASTLALWNSTTTANANTPEYVPWAVLCIVDKGTISQIETSPNPDAVSIRLDTWNGIVWEILQDVPGIFVLAVYETVNQVTSVFIDNQDIYEWIAIDWEWIKINSDATITDGVSDFKHLMKEINDYCIPDIPQS